MVQNVAQLCSLLWALWLHSACAALGTLASLFRPTMWHGAFLGWIFFSSFTHPRAAQRALHANRGAERGGHVLCIRTLLIDARAS